MQSSKKTYSAASVTSFDRSCIYEDDGKPESHREKDKDYRDPAGRWSERSAWSVRRNS